jgi:hypothetical protein
MKQKKALQHFGMRLLENFALMFIGYITYVQLDYLGFSPSVVVFTIIIFSIMYSLYDLFEYLADQAENEYLE